MKFIISLLLTLTALFAHGSEQNHLHFLGTLHLTDFFFLMIALVISFSTYKLMKKVF